MYYDIICGVRQRRSRVLFAEVRTGTNDLADKAEKKEQDRMNRHEFLKGLTMTPATGAADGCATRDRPVRQSDHPVKLWGIGGTAIILR